MASHSTISPSPHTHFKDRTTKLMNAQVCVRLCAGGGGGISSGAREGGGWALEVEDATCAQRNELVGLLIVRSVVPGRGKRDQLTCKNPPKQCPPPPPTSCSPVHLSLRDPVNCIHF